MRLVCSSSDRKPVEQFHRFLQGEGIAAVFEAEPERDTYRLWIVHEEDVERTYNWYRQFIEDPNDPRFSSSIQELLVDMAPKHRPPPPPRPARVQQGMGPITAVILLVNIAMYLGGVFTQMGIQATTMEGHDPILNPVYRALYFDYGRRMELLDELTVLYPSKQIDNPTTLPPEGRFKMAELALTPEWQGLYPVVVKWMRGESVEPLLQAPLFEKVRQGEVWRLFTPALLHALTFPLHIFFNMLWLVSLGAQMERRLRPSKYLLFTLIAGVFTNLAQYLVGGPNFLGYSGVVLAMLGFIWARSNKAPWEGYSLPPGTVLFVGAFVMLFAGYQVVAFVQEVTTGEVTQTMMANTAHLAGAFIGYVCGRLSLFRAGR